MNERSFIYYVTLRREGGISGFVTLHIKFIFSDEICYGEGKWGQKLPFLALRNIQTTPELNK